MSLMSIDVMIDATQVTTYIDSRIQALSDVGLGSVLDTQVLPYLKTRIADRFATSGDTATGPWAPLAPSTIANRKAMRVHHTKPLMVTGELFGYATNPPGTIAAPETDAVVLEYPAYQPANSVGRLGYKWLMAAYGLTNAFGEGIQVPRRPILAIDQTDLSTVLTMLSKWVL